MLEMLHAIIIKFPKSIVDEQSRTLFVHLVVCLANDQDNKVRSMTGEVIRVLVGHISQSSLHSILEYSLSWYLGEKQQLWSAGAQVRFSAGASKYMHKDAMLPIFWWFQNRFNCRNSALHCRLEIRKG